MTTGNEGGGNTGAGDGGAAAGAESGANGAENKASAGADGADGANNHGAESGNDGGSNSDSLLDGVEGDEGGDAQPVDFSKGKPEGFPDDAWDAKENKPKADVLFNQLKAAEKRAADLRAKLGKGDHKPPKEAKEYTFKPTEKGAKAFKDGDMSKDPVVAAVAPIALKHGLSKEQYAGFMADMTDVLVDMAEKSGSESPAELSDEEKAEIRKAEYAKIGTNAVQVIKSVESWGRELKASGQFSEAELAAFKSMAMTGEQVRVLNKLRAMAGGGNALPMDFSDDGLPSDNEIAELQAKVKTAEDQRKVDELYDKRRRAGRPERLAITP
jgi:hypothetical protein